MCVCNVGESGETQLYCTVNACFNLVSHLINKPLEMKKGLHCSGNSIDSKQPLHFQEMWRFQGNAVVIFREQEEGVHMNTWRVAVTQTLQ